MPPSVCGYSCWRRPRPHAALCPEAAGFRPSPGFTLAQVCPGVGLAYFGRWRGLPDAQGTESDLSLSHLIGVSHPRLLLSFGATCHPLAAHLASGCPSLHSRGIPLCLVPGLRTSGPAGGPQLTLALCRVLFFTDSTFLRSRFFSFQILSFIFKFAALCPLISLKKSFLQCEFSGAE